MGYSNEHVQIKQWTDLPSRSLNPPLALSGGATMSENVWLSMVRCKETWKR